MCVRVKNLNFKGQGLGMRFREEVEDAEVRVGMFNGRQPKRSIWTSENAMLVPNSIPPKYSNPTEKHMRSYPTFPSFRGPLAKVLSTLSRTARSADDVLCFLPVPCLSICPENSSAQGLPDGGTRLALFHGCSTATPAMWSSYADSMLSLFCYYLIRFRVDALLRSIMVCHQFTIR
ncbi:hypothetical protein EDD85DRAFT_603795 [Armillaria nabsnona]|nr:hypothetical protein EDD85DRAFT_603795 [Armillaria nabsnona]